MKEVIYTLTEEEKKKVEDKTINVSDLIDNFQKQTSEEQAKTLSFLDDLDKHEKKAATKEGIEKLPKVVQVLLNLSDSEWNRLPENGRELILEKMHLLKEKAKESPDVEDFDKLSEEKQEAILRSL